MKTALLVTTTFLLLGAGAVALQDQPEPPKAAEATEEHVWLRQLAGEWDVAAEMTFGPGAEPLQMRSTETVRRFGDYWVVAEGSMEAGPTPIRSRMQVGYDPRSEAFVGTWVDTSAPHMWVYRGSLDEGGTILTLEAEGPDMLGDPSKNRLFRDQIEMVSPDKKIMRSSARMDDGTWTEFMRAECTRRATKSPK